MMPKINLLLIAPEDDTVTGVLTRTVQAHFPDVELEVCHVMNAMDTLRCTKRDIILCDAAVTRENRVQFMDDLCGESPEAILLAITADTDLTKDKLTQIERGICVYDVLYKPIMISDLVDKLKRAIAIVVARKKP